MEGTASSATSDDGQAWQRAINCGIVAFLAAGVLLRLIRAIQNYPMWCDETMLAANLLDRDWTELARPLDYRQVCPIGFLALEWAAVRVAGFSELALRIFPLCAGVASVPLFFYLSRLYLGRRTVGLLLAVAVFAVSEPLIRYAGEAKPYESDLVASLLLLFLCARWLERGRANTELWIIALVVPVAVGVSLPSLFTIGAIGMVGVYELYKRRSAAIALPLAALLVTTSVSVGMMAVLGQYRVSPENRAYFLKFWAGAFPPSIFDPGAVLLWLSRMASGPLFAFPHGSDLRLVWLTPLIFVSALLGVTALLRQRRRAVALLLLPALLTLVAAALRRYPFGLSARVNLYLVPAVIVLAMAGLSWILSKIPRVVAQRRVIMALGCLLALFAVCRLGNDLGHPYRTPWDRTGREFARWFWEEMPAGGEVVCVTSDLGIPFGPNRWSYDGADQYLCYQRIYSRRHREGGLPRWKSISAQHPLRCVLLSRRPEEVPGFAKWIESHRDMYTLKRVQSYPATRGSAVEPALVYVVCELVPNEGAMAAGERVKLR